MTLFIKTLVIKPNYDEKNNDGDSLGKEQIQFMTISQQRKFRDVISFGVQISCHVIPINTDLTP